MDIEKLEALRRFYLEVKKRNLVNGEYSKKTRIGLFSKGFFAPSDLYDVNAGIEQLVAEGIIDTSGWFLDAGGGDGRVSALTAGHRIPSLYVEYNKELFALAEENIQELRDLSILDGTPIRIVRGNFVKDRTYRRAGIRFEDIATVFNYINNEHDIAAKIARQSPRGTVFILEAISWIPVTSGITKFEGLTYVKTIPPDSNSTLRRCLRVYSK